MQSASSLRTLRTWQLRLAATQPWGAEESDSSSPRPPNCSMPLGRVSSRPPITKPMIQAVIAEGPAYVGAAHRHDLQALLDISDRYELPASRRGIRHPRPQAMTTVRNQNSSSRVAAVSSGEGLSVIRRGQIIRQWRCHQPGWGPYRLGRGLYREAAGWSPCQIRCCSCAIVSAKRYAADTTPGWS